MVAEFVEIFSAIASNIIDTAGWVVAKMEIITSLLTTIAALGAVVVAVKGLNTWKSQIDFQQGRGLAVNLLQKFHEVKRKMEGFRTIGRPRYDDRLAVEVRTASFNSYADFAETFFDELTLALTEFERCCLEARIIWGVDFKVTISDLHDLEHRLKGAILSGANAMNPQEVEFMRKQHQETSYEFFDILWGLSKDPSEQSLSKRIEIVESRNDQLLPWHKLR